MFYMCLIMQGCLLTKYFGQLSQNYQEWMITTMTFIGNLPSKKNTCFYFHCYHSHYGCSSIPIPVKPTRTQIPRLQPATHPILVYVKRIWAWAYSRACPYPFNTLLNGHACVIRLTSIFLIKITYFVYLSSYHTNHLTKCLILTFFKFSFNGFLSFILIGPTI